MERLLNTYCGVSGGDWRKGNTAQRAFARIFALKENGKMFSFSCQHNGERSNVCDDVYGMYGAGCLLLCQLDTS